MAGRKFGAQDNPALTWAMNVHVPAIVAEHFRTSRIVAFSTGCVYPFVATASGGATRGHPAARPRRIRQSCIGRERMFEYFSQLYATPGRLFRLNYAIDMRYGVLFDVACKVRDKPTGRRVRWVTSTSSGRATPTRWRCAACDHATTPTTPINVSGPETISVRWLAQEFAGSARQEAADRRRGSADGVAHQHDAGRASFRQSARAARQDDRLDRRLGRQRSPKFQ